MTLKASQILAGFFSWVTETIAAVISAEAAIEAFMISS